jgi:hypothetical protein
MTFTRRSIGWLFSSLLFVGVAGSIRAEEDQELAWAEDILIRADIWKKAPKTGTRLWLTAPKLTILGGTKEQKQVVGDVVKHLNETLKSTPIKGIELLRSNDPRATLKVQFARRARIPAVAQVYRFPLPYVKEIARKKWSYASMFYSTPPNPWVVRSGLVLMSSDKEDADWLRSNTLNALCWLLGFMNHSKRYEKSVFFLDGDRRTKEVQLSERDRKLVRWYYNHVPPGTEELKMLFEKHWPKKD